MAVPSGTRGVCRSHRPRLLDRPATGAPVAADRVPDDNNDDRANGRDDDGRDVDAGRVVLAPADDARQEAANDRANDPQDDVADHAEALVALYEQSREPTGDGADDDPADDAHRFLASQFPTRAA